MDGVQFYDMNFFMREDHTRELMERLAPLGLHWWCEGRIDAICRYSDETLEWIRKAGCTMIFFGAESGSDRVLKEMKKGITTEQTLEVARRLRGLNIIPEFSFVVGNPRDPETDTRETIAFVRKIKRLNPTSEIIVQHYTPVPNHGKMYGGIDGKVSFPGHARRMGDAAVVQLHRSASIHPCPGSSRRQNGSSITSKPSLAAAGQLCRISRPANGAEAC